MTDDDGAPSKTMTEHRRSLRIPTAEQVFIRPLRFLPLPGKWIEGEILDISADGALIKAPGLRHRTSHIELKKQAHGAVFWSIVIRVVRWHDDEGVAVIGGAVVEDKSSTVHRMKPVFWRRWHAAKLAR